MKIAVSDHQHRGELSLSGRFDAHEVEPFNEAVKDLQAKGLKNFVVELGDVDFIDSAALAALVGLSRWCESQEAEAVLHHPSDPVRVILELTGLDQALAVSNPQHGE